MHDKYSFYKRLYKIESLHYLFYKRLSKDARLPEEVRELAKRLYKIEYNDSIRWARLADIKPSIDILLRIHAYLIDLLRRLFGIAFTMKLIEREEIDTEKELNKHKSSLKLSDKELSEIRSIERYRAIIEKEIKKRILRYEREASNIRDIVFGINDGLVEVLASVSGIATAIENPLLVIISGLIVALSGTLSMTVGAYLSTGAESSREDAKRSAKYVGLSYITGAVIPIIPFIIGFKHLEGIILAFLFTGMALYISSFIIAVMSNNSIDRYIAKTLIFSLSAALVTSLLGYIVRIALGVNLY
ncbi:MAG: VIT1/CCC1 family predicted Fe2+/Mn2+ transporter [Candidatus Micrarchaeota archaeon]|nr:MAG: VIT1/CCC1 family predicted Fe2+/Mn2+ transporter [Candidatus Micrarchaeota archaeon]